MNNALTPQAETLLAHLKAGGTLTNRSAHIDFAVGSLTKRISEIRGAGHNVIGEWQTNHKTGQRFMRYSLAQGVEQLKVVPGKTYLLDMSKLNTFCVHPSEHTGDYLIATYIADEHRHGAHMWVCHNMIDPRHATLEQHMTPAFAEGNCLVGETEAPKKEFDKYVVVEDPKTIQPGDKLMLLEINGVDVHEAISTERTAVFDPAALKGGVSFQSGRCVCTVRATDAQGNLTLLFGDRPQWCHQPAEVYTLKFARLENAQ